VDAGVGVGAEGPTPIGAWRLPSVGRKKDGYCCGIYMFFV
jgi:hypothetical protein